MQPSRAVLLAAICLLVAGCGAKPQHAVPTTGSGDPDKLPPGVTNRLEGTVGTTDLQPLGGVNVTIPSMGAYNITDEEGYYHFESLPPKDYIITAKKEGFREKTLRAVIEDDKIFELDFQLQEIPSAMPFNETDDYIGQISCEIAYQTAPDNTQWQNCGEADTNNKQRRAFSVREGAAQIVVEVDWDPQPDASKVFEVSVEQVGSDAVQYAKDRGGPGMKLLVSQSLVTKTLGQGGQVMVSVHVAPNVFGDEAGADWGAAFQQEFTIYFTVFYVEPGPYSFTAIPPK